MALEGLIARLRGSGRVVNSFSSSMGCGEKGRLRRGVDGGTLPEVGSLTDGSSGGASEIEALEALLRLRMLERDRVWLLERRPLAGIGIWCEDQPVTVTKLCHSPLVVETGTAAM